MSIPTYAQLEDSFHLAITTGLGIPGSQVFWANQTRPVTMLTFNTYASLEVASIKMGDASCSNVVGPTNITLVTVSPMTLDVNVQVFNNDNTGINSALARCARLANYLQDENTRYTLDLATITVRIGNINHIPVSYNTKYVDRAVFNMKVDTLISTSSTVPWITDVQGDLQVNQLDGTHQHYPL